MHALQVNGAPSEQTYIDVKSARTLDFTLSKTPDTNWGTAMSDAPPSFPAGPIKFPA